MKIYEIFLTCSSYCEAKMRISCNAKKLFSASSILSDTAFSFLYHGFLHICANLISLLG